MSDQNPIEQAERALRGWAQFPEAASITIPLRVLIAEHIAPWDREDGCFGHCDPEGWYAPCREGRKIARAEAERQLDQVEEYAEQHGHPPFQDEPSAFLVGFERGVEWVRENSDRHRAEKAEAERDAALAKLEEVRKWNAETGYGWADNLDAILFASLPPTTDHTGRPSFDMFGEPRNRAAQKMQEEVPVSNNEAEREALAAILLTKTGHKISGNSQGGYDCTCGGRWDWSRAERDEAYLHAALKTVDLILASGFRRVQVTDEMVSEADRAYVLAMASDPRPWFAMRAALEAGLNGKSK